MGAPPVTWRLPVLAALLSAAVLPAPVLATRPEFAVDYRVAFEPEDGTEFGEIVGDDSAVDPAENLSDKNLQEEIADLLRVLDDRERKIIMSRFGLDGGNSRTLEEVGEKFGVTRERIRQLQNIALAKLRRALRKREHPIEHLIASRADDEDLAAITSNN